MSAPRSEPPAGPPPTVLSPEGLDRLSLSLSALRLLGAGPGGPEQPERAFGRFRLLDVLGRGKFGIVFLADDPDTGRQVALKLPQPDVLIDPLLGERFRRDAEAAGPLDHPGIVPILESGHVGAVPYLVMAYVPGPSLSAWLARQTAPVPVDQAVDLVGSLADAVHHAHQRGVLHCDLKPANVLLTPRGSEPATQLKHYQPRISDFGLARLLHRDPEQTRTHLTAGSPPYMAPEQVLGARRDLTAQCDVHALAAILYELLTRRQPYDAPSETEQLAQLLDPQCPPDSPRRLRPELPGDLEAIVLKGLENAPEARYANAGEMAADLRRFREGRPTRARPVGAWGRATRWARRRPVVTTLLLSVLFATALAIGLGTRLALVEAKHRQELELAEQAARLQEFHVGLQRVQQRRLEQSDGWAEKNLAELRHLAALAAAREHQPELCSEAAMALAAPSLRLVRQFVTPGVVNVAAFSPDGATLALGEQYPHDDIGGQLRIWLVRVTTGEIVRELRYPVDLAWEKRHGDRKADGARALAFSPDGEWLVAGTRSGRLVRWELRERAPRAVVWEAHRGGLDPTKHEIRTLVFSDDGAVLLSAPRWYPGAIRRWDVRGGWLAAGYFPAELSLAPATVRDRAWAIRPGQSGWHLHALDLREGAFREGEATGVHLNAFCTSPDGGQLAIVPRGRGLTRWQVSARRPDMARPLLGPSAQEWNDDISDITFTADGWLITRSPERGAVEVWDMVGASLAGQARLRGDGRVAPSPDGRHLAFCGVGRVAGEEERVSLFQLTPSRTRRPAVREPHEVRSFALSADGQELATISNLTAHRSTGPKEHQGWQETVTQYRRNGEGYDQEHQFRVAVPGWPQPGLAVKRGAGGPEVAVSSGQRNLSQLTLFSGARLKTNWNGDAQFGPDGRLWASDGAHLLCWSGADVRRVSTVTATEDRAGVSITRLAPTPHGTFVGLRDGKLLWFDPAVRLRASWPVFANQEITSLAIDADGGEVLVGGERGAVARVAVPSGAVRLRTDIPHRDAVNGLAYLSDGVTLTASADHTIRLWDQQDRSLLVLREGGPIVKTVLAGGRELFFLVRGEWGVRVWDLAELHSGLRALGLSPRWSAPEGPAPVPRTGSRHGLQAELYDDATFGWLALRRIDEQVNFDWKETLPSPWVTSGTYSVRWTGYLQAPRAGRWEIQRKSDGATTMWVDGQRELDRAYVKMPATPVSFRLDYVKDKSGRCQLLWRPAGSDQPFVPIPPTAFLPAKPAAFAHTHSP